MADLFSLSLCLHDVREKGGCEYFKRIKIYSDYLKICKIRTITKVMMNESCFGIIYGFDYEA